MNRDAERSFERLLPRLEMQFAEHTGTPDWQIFNDRLYRHFENLFDLLRDLYGTRYDFFYHLEQVLVLAAESWFERSTDLKQLDAERERNPYWFQSEKMLGGVYYVDLLAGNLRRLRGRLPYLKELGITYLHLMPLFRAPMGIATAAMR